MFHKIISELRKINNQGSFARNVSIVSSWNIAIILVQIGLSPIVTRFYAPAEYGVFALFSSIILNVGIVSTFRYSEAIVVANTREQRNNTILLSLILVSFISLISFALVFFFKSQIILFLGVSWMEYFIFLIPLGILINGITEILLLINVSQKKFGRNGLAGFFMNLLSRGFTICYASIAPAKAIGLVGGDVFGKATAAVTVLFSFKRLDISIKNFLASVSLRGLFTSARIYRNFPIFIMPTNVMIGLSNHLPIYFLQAQFNSSIVGSFALASSLLEIINRLIPYSVSSVFFPKAMEVKKFSLEKLSKDVYKLYWLMLVGALFIFSLVALFGELIFPWVFGNSWLLAGTFTAILSVQYAFNFVAVALSELYKVVDKQRFLLVTTLVSVFLKVIAIYFIISLQLNEKFALLWFGLASAAGSVLQIVGIFIIFRYKIWKVCGSMALMLVVLLLLNYLITF